MLFTKEKREPEKIDILPLPHKAEWDIVIVGDYTCGKKDVAIARYIDNSQVEWEEIPVSDNFKWKRARVNVLGKVLNIWDSDFISNENVDVWSEVADKIRMSDAWIWLQPGNEPIPSRDLELLIDSYLNQNHTDAIYKRCIGVFIDALPEYDRYTKAFEKLNDDSTSQSERKMINQLISGDWMGMIMFSFSFADLCDYNEVHQTKRAILKLLLSSPSNS